MDNWLLKILHQLINVISPNLRELIVKFVQDFEKQAKHSSSPWDDIAAALLKFIFAVK